MGALMLGLAIFLAAPTATPSDVAQWKPQIERASRRFGISADWIERVMRAESGGATMLNGLPIRSRAGAMGLMQLMPGTWSDMRDAYELGPNPDDASDNILAGTAYLRLLYDRFGYPGVFGAYNAGPARYADFLAGKGPLPNETRAYMIRLVPSDREPDSARRRTPQVTMFAIRHDLAGATSSRTADVGSAGLFAISGAPR